MYFSMHDVRHFCSPALRLVPGVGTHFSKQLVFALEMRTLALVTLDCSTSTLCSRWSVAEDGDGDEGERIGLVMLVDEDDDDAEELFSLSLDEDEDEPPNTPPNAMLAG